MSGKPRQRGATTKARQNAHSAMHDLWEATESTLRQLGNGETSGENPPFSMITTELGATIIGLARSNYLAVQGEFEKPDGTTELVEVTFAEDIRDLSQSTVFISWHNEGGEGNYTPPVRDYPKIARELLSLIPLQVMAE